jgi:hypothetical protein
MSNQERILLEKKSGTAKSRSSDQTKKPKPQKLPLLLQRLGNRTVQRLAAQRSGNGPYQLDEETANRIHSSRSSGQPLESQLQKQMSEQFGYDMSGVKVHTNQESNALNQDLSARAFTTGHDIFFKEGAYDPNSTDGQKLLSHELAHVVQQGIGQVRGSGGMTVNAPGDRYEQEADAAAGEISHTVSAAGVQKQEMPEEEELAQTQSEEEDEEEEAVQTQEEDEEELVQPQEEEEDVLP